MKTIVTLVGSAGGDPVHGMLEDGRPFANLRLAVNRRHYDRQRDTWVDGETSWYDVRAYGQLASHVTSSVAKGDPLVVHGELSVRAWQSEERSGTAVQVVARTIGPDLRFGTARFARNGQPRRDAEGWSLASPPPAPGQEEPEEPEDDAQATADGSGPALQEAAQDAPF